MEHLATITVLSAGAAFLSAGVGLLMALFRLIRLTYLSSMITHGLLVTPAALILWDSGAGFLNRAFSLHLWRADITNIADMAFAAISALYALVHFMNEVHKSVGSAMSDARAFREAPR
ncbi:MAG TPA: hypothetical protein VGB91_02645 [Rhizomicrobium sp.]